MSITKDQIIEGVAALSVMEIVELISAMEEKFRSEEHTSELQSLV